MALKKTKICTKCKKQKPLSDFFKQKTGKNGYCSHCKKCHYKYGTSKESHHRYRLKKKYGLTPENWQQMFEEQQGRCAICEIPQSELSHKLCVDHNHKTGKVRQLVCRRCNLLIDTFEHKFYGFENKLKDYFEKNDG